ncbi:hypothetical protein O7605_20970 [Verrucosispora sp. WMMA2121]|uniref:hypothetical protein n=1 Tax=Verrucosispora sp. WMMA2121 TaxID=3015164 RepID=UPI0022B710BA|nr:hypothetical protein [Verrucosispora sp. WMMA2121]MCZ7421975.1 hypothetical protein [Verrucosispora sp. WMMA2121]
MAEYAMAVWRGTAQLLVARTPIDGGPLTDLQSAIAAFPVAYRGSPQFAPMTPTLQAVEPRASLVRKKAQHPTRYEGRTAH